MTSKTVFTGAILAALAVMLGAFGSHLLKSRIEPEQMDIFKTAVQYHMLHAIALVAIGVYGKMKPSKRLENAIFAFYLGIGLFSGSLYIYVLSFISRFDMRWMNAITPLGGVALIIGWIQVAWATKAPKQS